jgi:shikimate kinase / 3-dehydroquinate synthase
VTERIVLVGFMAAGKTTVGALVAEILGWEFVDLDQRVEAGTGRTIADIFRDSGEAAFRDAELAAANSLAGTKRVVIAAGGGAFAEPATRAALQERAFTVWVRCALPVLLDRLAGDESRPLAANRETIAALLPKRETTYALADLVVDTTRSAPRVVARTIVDAAFREEPGPIQR